jgi:pyruvate dehydrogenase E2 component (dihydrolipoamide acetyltransferase)
MARYEFKLPDIGEGVVEGEIVKWLVKAGDAVIEDQPLVEVMTDKATVTIPSPKKGKVTRTYGEEGSIAKVHHPLVELELDGGGAGAPKASRPSAPKGNGGIELELAPLAVPPRAAPPPAVAAAVSGERVLATPVTRRMAREHGLDLAHIAGTGPQGRVLKSDVEALIAGNGAGPKSHVGAVATGPVARAPEAAPVRAPEKFVPLASSAQDQRIPIRGLRKKIADKMTRAKFTAPHYTFVEELDVTDLVALRARLNAEMQAAGETLKISFLPFLCKALASAFRRFPQVNANMDEAAQDLVVRGEYNIGIAAMTDQGLTVPVVKNVDRRSLKDLAREIARLGTAAREQKLKIEELTGGTFTITSLGQTGGLFATPIINHPEVAIMGVHRMRKRPVVLEDDRIVVRQMALFSFCFDHRNVDGALGAQFAYEFLKYIEQPELLFLELL